VVRVTPRNSKDAPSPDSEERVYGKEAGVKDKHVAALLGDVHKLLRRSIDPNAPDLEQRVYGKEAGVTDVHVAALLGDVHKLVNGLRRGIDPNARCIRDITPLHLACKSGHLAVVQLLVKHGAEVSARSSQGVVPIQVAVSHGHTAVVRYLRDIQCSEAVRVSLSEFHSSAARQHKVRPYRQMI
jgi:ankyrin repeat protein